MSKKVYRSSQDWYKNRHNILIFQRNILFIFSLVLTSCLFFSTIFINYISNNKSLEPYVIEIEKVTGKPKIIKVDEIKKITEDKVVKKYFITNLVKSLFFYRIANNSSELEVYLTRKNDEFIKNFSSKSFRKFFIDKKRKLTKEKIHSVDVRIKTIQFPAEDLNVAKVRILRTVKFNNGDVKNFNELLEIGFRIDHESLKNENQKEQNPIGFIANEYSVTEESFEY
jgi:type IV secretion system protein VirB8